MNRPAPGPGGWGNPEIEAAVRRLLDAGLGQGRSTIEPEVAAWAPDVAVDLRHRIIDNADAGTGGFIPKLKAQLTGASRETHLLAAELLYLQVAPLSNIKGGTKRERISTVLSWMSPPARLPSDLETASGLPGVLNGGVGFNVQIWQQLGWLLSFVEHWWQLSQDDRQRAMSDPWDFRAVVADVPTGQVGMRNALLYLMFPQTFSPIVNQDHKREIRNAFAELVGGRSGDDALSIDRDLLAIRERHERDFGFVVDWYDEPFGSQWQKLADEGQRAWLVRPRPGGAELVARWRDDGFVSLAAKHLGDVPAGSDRNAVRTAVETGYQHLDYSQRLSLATEYHSFLSMMKDDDVVATVVDDHLHVGVVTGTPEYSGAADARLTRSVAWTVVDPRPVADLPAPLPEELAQQGTVVDLTSALSVLLKLAVTDDGALPPDDEPEAEPAPPIGPPLLPAANADLSAAVHAEVSWLQEIIDLLAARQQIVLYGPPGTGKTFVARALARHLTDPDAVRLVQFHPSYSYEDFFEGYRPTKAADGSVGFELRPGPLRALAAEARADRARPYVLIIDEINRANLAKVFGELYFLLEYRSDTIRLQYSPEDSFSLPPNVFLVGTMNTADRSIALVDAAMRRRFAFVEMHPDEEPVSGLLPRWLAANDKSDDRAALLAALNAEIGAEDHDYKIGPSYLMTPDVETASGLDRVWEYSILPLLEEHYYGRLTRAQVRERFGLAAIRARIAGAEPTGP